MKMVLRLGLIAVFLVQLNGCSNLSRLSNVGKPPPFTEIKDPRQRPNYRPVSLPMPASKDMTRNKNSLWSNNARSIFTDQRASQIGDILTVTIDIKDTASMKNESSRGRQNGENMGVPSLFGYEGSLVRDVLPPGVDPGKLVDMSSSNSNKGKGEIKRNEQISLKVAALITEILPNGNFVISGKQEVRVNYELRDLRVSGIVRPEDVSTKNTIGYDKIAEARIAYGGRGQITDVQQPRMGSQLLDIFLPF